MPYTAAALDINETGMMVFNNASNKAAEELREAAAIGREVGQELLTSIQNETPPGPRATPGERAVWNEMHAGFRRRCETKKVRAEASTSKPDVCSL